VVLDHLAREPPGQVPADGGEPARGAVVLGLLVTQPHRLRRGVRGVRLQPGPGGERVRPRGTGERLGLPAGAAVEPDDRGPQRPQVVAERDESVDLAGEPEHADLGPALPGLPARLADRRRDRALPRRGVLLGPAVVRVRHRQRRARRRQHGAALVGEQRLDALRPDVDPDDVHPRPPGRLT
jgi:hypothetical protein